MDCTPLLFKIVEHIPAPKDADPEGEFKMLVSNIDWDDYVGRVAIGRITSGTVKKGDTVWASPERRHLHFRQGDPHV